MHIQAYFSIFRLIVLSKANHLNQYSTCCGQATLELLLSPAEYPHQGYSQLCWTMESAAAAGT